MARVPRYPARALLSDRLADQPHDQRTSEPMSETARVVVVGGGIWGCSIAYHLARAGVSDVLVLERGELASGNTSQAAGLVGQLRASELMARSIMAVVDRRSEERRVGKGCRAG